MLKDVSNFGWLETCVYWGKHSASSNDGMEGICMFNDYQKGVGISNDWVPAMRGLR